MTPWAVVRSIIEEADNLGRRYEPWRHSPELTVTSKEELRDEVSEAYERLLDAWRA